ncbi:MAG TPA: hypothetical protein VD813_03210 [Pseudonocardia sp.]|nr:hypothetical protein [Pseudonocardia sp.]
MGRAVLTIIAVLLVGWLALSVVGALVEGLLWLAVVGAVLFVGSAAVAGMIRGRRARKQIR